MSELDTIIRGGRVANASDTVVCDVGIRGGKIVALGEHLGAADEVIDAAGKLVLPGGIDSHVHFAQPSGPGIVMADDFESGTRAAAFGGNTLVMPFCMQEKGQSLRQAVKDYHAKAEGRCHVDVSFHLVISDPTPNVLGQELPALVGDGYTSFKVFMTYQDLALSDMPDQVGGVQTNDIPPGTFFGSPGLDAPTTSTTGLPNESGGRAEVEFTFNPANTIATPNALGVTAPTDGFRNALLEQLNITQGNAQGDIIALVQLKGRWQTVLLVPTVYLAACVWEARLAVEPSVTRQILVGAILIVMMNARPQGLLGTRRVEVV